MKLRFAFAISKTERKLRLRFWKWEIWRFDEAAAEEIKKDPSKAGAVSFEETDNQPDFEKLLFQTLFYPNVEQRIWRVCKKLFNKTRKLFKISIEKLEIKGTLYDPFCDAVAMGMSGGCYFPNWEDENGDWSAKGEVIFKSGIFHFIFFALSLIYEAAILAFILWRGVRLAKKYPNGENMDDIRKWIFLKCRS